MLFLFLEHPALASLLPARVQHELESGGLKKEQNDKA
jgi:hypothetical protein